MRSVLKKRLNHKVFQSNTYNAPFIMSHNSVYYGRHLQKIPLSSYLSHSPVARGIGGVIRPKNIFTPINLHVPKVNSAVNVLDEVKESSDFTESKSKSDADTQNPLDSDKIFTPIKIKESEVGVLKKEKPRKRSKAAEKKKIEVPTSIKKKAKYNNSHRFKLE
jgi:hypothetical protein